jgi:hypothetical protein
MVYYDYTFPVSVLWLTFPRLSRFILYLL